MNADHFSKDIRDFIECLSNNNVRYLIVGGEAAIYYGNPRLTGDVDFFYDPSAENAIRLYSALNEFWSGDIPGLNSADELQEEGVIVQFGVPPNRIDLINLIDGISFEEAWQGRETAVLDIGDTQISAIFIGIDQLILNKEAAARPKDQEDLKYLIKARENRHRK